MSQQRRTQVISANVLDSPGKQPLILQGGSNTFDSRYVLTSSYGVFTSSYGVFAASYNTFTASVVPALFTASYDARYALTASAVIGTGATNQLTYWSGIKTVTSSPNVIWDPSSVVLTVSGTCFSTGTYNSSQPGNNNAPTFGFYASPGVPGSGLYFDASSNMYMTTLGFTFWISNATYGGTTFLARNGKNPLQLSNNVSNVWICDPNGNTTQSGALTAASVGSAQGFKCVIGPFIYYNGTYPGGVQSTGFAGQNSSFFDSPSYPWVAPFPGSVLAITGRAYSSTTTTVQANVQRNVVNNGQSTSTAISAGAHVSISQTYAKGAYPFIVGDGLAYTTGASTSGQVLAVSLWLLVEMQA